jgi:hypothetical protein
VGKSNIYLVYGARCTTLDSTTLSNLAATLGAKVLGRFSNGTSGISSTALKKFLIEGVYSLIQGNTKVETGRTVFRVITRASILVAQQIKHHQVKS